MCQGRAETPGQGTEGKYILKDLAGDPVQNSKDERAAMEDGD